MDKAPSPKEFLKLHDQLGAEKQRELEAEATAFFETKLKGISPPEAFHAGIAEGYLTSIMYGFDHKLPRKFEAECLTAMMPHVVESLGASMREKINWHLAQ